MVVVVVVVASALLGYRNSPVAQVHERGVVSMLGTGMDSCNEEKDGTREANGFDQAARNQSFLNRQVLGRKKETEHTGRLRLPIIAVRRCLTD